MSTDDPRSSSFKGNMPTQGIPILGFLLFGETVSALNLHVRLEAGVIRFSLKVTPVTRIGRALPDWPQALSLRPDLSERAN